jgi:hypothetical protein
MTRASTPMRIFAEPRSTPRMIVFAASSGEVPAIFAKLRAVSSSSTPSGLRAARAMLVSMPPGCTQLTPTLCRAMSISSRSASVNPRTPNFVAL